MITLELANKICTPMGYERKKGDTMITQQERVKYITGTDVAAISGNHPYKKPIDVWMQKTGRAEPPDLSQNEAVQWGIRLEPVIAELYAKETGYSLSKTDTLYHPDYDWIAGTPDRLVLTPGGRGILEVKTAGIRQAARWDDDRMPDEYYLQVAWYLIITGREFADIRCLIGGQELKAFTIDATQIEGFKDNLINEIGGWRERHIIKDTPPEPDDSENYSNALKKIYPANMGEIIQAGESACDNIIAMAAVKAVLDKYESEKRLLENEIKLTIGDADGVESSHGKITWKKTKDGVKTDWQAIAVELGADGKIIAKHTKAKPGYRRIYKKFYEQGA